MMAARKDDLSNMVNTFKNSKKAGAATPRDTSRDMANMKALAQAQAGVAKRPSSSAGAKTGAKTGAKAGAPKRPAVGGVYKALPVKKKTKGTVSIY
jgi:flagellar hook-associated protein FlgK